MRQKRIKVIIELKNFSYDALNLLKFNIDEINKINKNYYVELIFWYDSNTTKLSSEFIKDVSFIFDIDENKIYSHYPRYIKNIMFSILYSNEDKFENAIKNAIGNSKFFIFYNDEKNSSVYSVNELISFIKAKMNYEVTKNEVRNNSK